mgnify:FL=1
MVRVATHLCSYTKQQEGHKMQVRVRAIVVQNNALLLIHRVKKNKEYWVFPGGGVEEGETEKTALVREAREELGVEIVVGEQFTVYKLGSSTSSPAQQEVFYFCVITGGKLGSGSGPEFQRDTVYEGMYALEWVPFTEMSRMEILPEAVKNKFLKEKA